MKIFKVDRDSNNIQALNPVDFNKINLEFGTFDCKPRAANWEELIVYIHNPKITAKNFYAFFLGTLAFDEVVLDACQDLFERTGEILPLQVERGPKLYALNVLDCRNGLNYDTTQWDYYDDGSKGRILKFGFHPERVMNESSIFKIPEVSKTHIFTFSGVKDEEDEFYGLYHKHKLTGLIFEEVYSD